MHTLSKNKKGFTLIETLVAITILLLAVTGTITTAQKGLQSAYYATDQETAVFLAQEAIESIREYRDSKALNAYHNSITGTGSTDTANWLPSARCDQLTNGCVFNGAYFTEATCTIGQGSNCDVVSLDVNNGVYNQNGTGNSTKFRRRVYIDTTQPGGVEVTVDVNWDTPLFSNKKHVNLTTWIYDHYQHIAN